MPYDVSPVSLTSLPQVVSRTDLTTLPLSITCVPSPALPDPQARDRVKTLPYHGSLTPVVSRPRPQSRDLHVSFALSFITLDRYCALPGMQSHAQCLALPQAYMLTNFGTLPVSKARVRSVASPNHRFARPTRHVAPDNSTRLACFVALLLVTRPLSSVAPIERTQPLRRVAQTGFLHPFQCVAQFSLARLIHSVALACFTRPIHDVALRHCTRPAVCVARLCNSRRSDNVTPISNTHLPLRVARN